MKLLLLFSIFVLLSFNAFSRVDHETIELNAEFGSSYHTVTGKQKSNNSTGRLSSVESPFFRGLLGFRITKNVGLALYAGSQIAQFEKSPKFELKNRNLPLFHAGLETFWRSGNYTRLAFFIEQKERPQYIVEKPKQIRMYAGKFVQPGFHFSLQQDRRIGILWNLGLKGFLMEPSKGGAIATELGYGAEAYARLGFVGFAGTQFHVKGFYGVAAAPNAKAEFTNDELGFSGQLTKTF